MKTLTAAVAFVLTLGLFGITTVNAAFNNRGPEFPSQITPSRTANAADFAQISLAFTDRGTELRNASFAPSGADLSKVCEIAQVQGFNEKEYNKQTC